MTTSKSYYYGTGRRKSAIARVRIYPGTGQIVVNGKSPEAYFGGRAVHERTVIRPFQIADQSGRWNVMVKVAGGGTTGQAGAVAHGLARALLDFDSENLRSALKRAGLLTRDPRVKERKKVGLKRARRAPQYTKR